MMRQIDIWLMLMFVNSLIVEGSSHILDIQGAEDPVLVSPSRRILQQSHLHLPSVQLAHL